ncbi:MAG: deaminase, partial [Promethearchaeota archaeon]
AIHGTSIKGETILYTTTFPCTSCLKLLINAGIKKIVYKEEYSMDNEVKQNLVKESHLIIQKI